MITHELAIIIGAIILLIYTAIALMFKINSKRIITTDIFIAYLTVVAIITLFPIMIEEKVEYFGDVTWYNFIPLRTITQAFQNGVSLTALIQVFGNILIAVPYGVLIIMLSRNKNWKKMLLLALVFPIAIELTQLVIGLAINNMYRNIDIDDVILNCLGVYAGYAIYKILPAKIKSL